MGAAPELNPYATPKATDYVGSFELPPLATKARTARAFLFVRILMLIVANLVGWLLPSEQTIETYREKMFTVGSPLFIAGVCGNLLRLGAVIAFLVWLHTAYVRAIVGVANPRFTPAASVGWWFVPFANLWMPFDAMRHLWQLSRGGAEWRSVSPPARLTLWWIALWLSSCLTWVEVALVVSSTSRLPGQVLDYVSPFVSIAAALLAARIVREITALQRERLGQD